MLNNYPGMYAAPKRWGPSVKLGSTEMDPATLRKQRRAIARSSLHGDKDGSPTEAQTKLQRIAAGTVFEFHIDPVELRSMGLPFHAPAAETDGDSLPGTPRPDAASDQQATSARVYDDEGRPLFLERPDGSAVLASRLRDGQLVPFGAAPPLLELDASVLAHFNAMKKTREATPKGIPSKNAAIAGISSGEMSLATRASGAVRRPASSSARRERRAGANCCLSFWLWFDCLTVAVGNAAAPEEDSHLLPLAGALAVV
jgi:hypothetical protein